MRRLVRRLRALTRRSRSDADQQRGSVDLSIVVALSGMLVVGGGLVGQMVSEPYHAQEKAAELFASSWSRAELNAPANEQASWQAYRTCWVAREGKPFVGDGGSLMSWKDRPTPADYSGTETDPTGGAAAGAAGASNDLFTAEDLFDLCARRVGQARAHDPAEPVVRGQVQAMLRDRELDVDAMTARPAHPLPQKPGTSMVPATSVTVQADAIGTQG